jgi:AcrR family transcriptional regulator
MPYVRRKPSAPAASRQKVIDAVHALLAEGVFHDSTVEDVATRAGVSRATVYQQFRSRVGLVDAICERFDATPELLALREAESLTEWVRLATAFWAREEQPLLQLYGVAAVDPAAHALVERQRRDRRSELVRMLKRLGVREEQRILPLLLVLTSFETYLELRRHAGLSLREVTRTVTESAEALLRA